VDADFLSDKASVLLDKIKQTPMFPPTEHTLLAYVMVTAIAVFLQKFMQY
jgi:hypothetical protein